MPTRYSNPWPDPPCGLREVLRWKLGLGGCIAPAFPDATQPAPVVPLSRADLNAMPERGWRVIWLGHASFLLSGAGAHLLVDPVFSRYCSPLPLPWFKRHAPPPCQIADLPPITAVLLTHGHYDHCDLTTLRQLGREMLLVVPAGHGDWLGRCGFTNLTELNWWERLDLAGSVAITATPARHFTARTLWDRNLGHWCGWAVTAGGTTLWHSGDTAYMPAFREIGTRLGPVDFGMISIGAYSPRWFMEAFHMTPAEAVRAAREAGCRRALGMHWGTFHLSDEPLGEPPLLLAAALSELGEPADYFTTGPVGGQWDVPPAAVG